MKRYSEQEKQNLIDQLWLHYYNQYLFEKGVIPREAYIRMKAMINCKKLRHNQKSSAL